MALNVFGNKGLNEIWLDCVKAADIPRTVGCEVDFARKVAKIRPALHSSGFPVLMAQDIYKDTNKHIKEMGFEYARTHDWSLVCSGARVIDDYFIFPLRHLDAKDPKNYYFKATDHLLNLQKEAGTKIFYRLGASIEHNGGGTNQFNTVVPEDFNKQAETFAGTVRHYTRGWADGFKWDIKYWEIWGEPDSIKCLWCLPGPEGKDPIYMRDKFVEMFVICLKRLKKEFPELKFGGPGLGWMWEDYFRALLTACKKEGLKPDFISWHSYDRGPDKIIAGAEKAKELCDSLGMDNVEFLLNEWHFLPRGGFSALRSQDTSVCTPAKIGPTAINGIESAAYTLTMLAKLQISLFDQAYFYGCMHSGNWGYRDEEGNFNKNFYALKTFGQLMKGGYTDICASSSDDGRVTTFAVKGSDGSKALLVVDYTGRTKDIQVALAGLDGAKIATAKRLSDCEDLADFKVEMENGELHLEKPDEYSAAFYITFK